MQQVRYAVWVVVAVVICCMLVPVTPQGGHVAWVTAKGTLRVADVVTLTIRPDMKFHNGEPLTAADVKLSFET